jgi:TPR repeat protein
VRPQHSIVWAVACWLLAISYAQADDAVIAGLRAWRDHDYVVARAYWQQASDSGDTQAKFLLSQLYAQGQGGPPDPQRALALLRESAQGGYAVACFNLGDRYLKGDGVPQDASQAARWWRCAALQGLAHAQFSLGNLYYQGLGVQQDRAQALWWYREAAAQGSRGARQMLAQLGVSPEAEETDAAAQAPTGSPAAAKAAMKSPSRVRATQPPHPTPSSAEARQVAGPVRVKAAAGLPAMLKSLALGPDWLRRQPAEFYTVQVFASNDATAVSQFLQRFRFNRQVAVYPFRKEGNMWYGVVYGRFAAAAAARRVIPGLPTEVRRARPWVRHMGELRTIIELRSR